jgi:allantoinase
VDEARRRRVDSTCETCPQNPVMMEEDLETLGAVAKRTPPLRPRAERDAL